MAREGANKHMTNAKKGKYDEFYTRLVDVERELKHYKKHFKNKVVFCNCDDPRKSSFFHFFSHKFEEWGLKKLITTCYKNQQMDLFSEHKSEKAIYLEYNGDRNQNKVPDPEEIGIKNLKGDGDFRSEECIELLKQSDIVVTNPPFSKFSEYVVQIMKYKKKFLILGEYNPITYKAIFPLIKENKIWIGMNSKRQISGFIVPEHYPLSGTEAKIVDGDRIVKTNRNCWYTNLDNDRQQKELPLYKKYNKTEYPAYENYDAIEVSYVEKIPIDYKGVMGVPITFMDKYNEEQFEIIGCSYSYGEPEGYHIKGKGWGAEVDGKIKYKRLFIKSKN